MENLNETARTFSFPSRIKRIGTDLVLTTRDFFVILSDEDLKAIANIVFKNGKSVLLQNDTLYVYSKEQNNVVFLIIEVMRNNNFKSTMMVNSNILSL